MYSKIIEAYPKYTSCSSLLKENFGGAFSIYGALKFPQRNCSPVVNLNGVQVNYKGDIVCPKKAVNEHKSDWN